MDILSCPGALLALNDFTILFNSPTVSGCNEMDSERALLKKSLGDEFVEGNLLAKIWPYIGEVITEFIGNVSRIGNFHFIFCEACRIR